MTPLKLPALLLGATALTLPMAATPAAAQQQQEITRDNACQELYRLVQQAEQAGEELVQEFREAAQVAEQNDADACLVIIEQADEVGGVTAESQERNQAEADQAADADTETETFTARDRVSQTVEIEQEAVVEGEVMVRQPIPEIGIEQPGPQVEVSEGQVDVGIEEQPAEIVVRQAPANVRVEIPRPTITIEQPAPEIVIHMPPPGVRLDREQPQVSVNIPDPTVTVTQAEPEVTADVQARFVGGDELTQLDEQGRQPQVTTQIARTDAAGQEVDTSRQAEVTLQKGEAEVMIHKSEQQGEVSFQRAEPRVVYQPAEPNIELSFAQDAEVQVQQVGEPTVRIEREGDQQAAQGQQEQQGQQAAALQGQQQEQQAQPQQEQQTAQQPGQEQQTAQQPGQEQQQPVEAEQQAATQEQPAAGGQQTEEEVEVRRLSPEETNRMLGITEGGEIEAGQPMQVTAADLQGRDVLTVNGEEVGDVEEVVTSGGELYVIVAHGGFLGIGETQVAIPADRIALHGDQVILLGLTEEQLEQMPNYDYESDQALGAADPVEINTYQ